MNKSLEKSLEDILINLAKKISWNDSLCKDDCTVDDFAGGNVDDAFDGGFSAGQISLARNLCALIGLEYTVED